MKNMVNQITEIMKKAMLMKEKVVDHIEGYVIDLSRARFSILLYCVTNYFLD